MNNNKQFWNEEYESAEMGGEHLRLSDNPSGDLLTFIKWLEKIDGVGAINKDSFIVDAGCGNGRNLLYLNKIFSCKGIGYDISSIAIEQANEKFLPLDKGGRGDLKFSIQDLKLPIPTENEKVDYVLDMMSSHVLRQTEREFFKNEVVRVLGYKGYLLVKTFLRDEDIHSKELLKKYPDPLGEVNAYIHPAMGIYEYVPSEKELIEFYEQDFDIEKVERSYGHIKRDGSKGKRRYIVLYLRKK
jgi:SAM-dependent methyltransferase